MGWNSTRFRTSSLERAATMIEYALLVALLAVATIAGLSQLQETARAKTEQSAAGISSREIPTVTTSPSGGGGGGDDGDTTTTEPEPTTTAPTTTAPAPTTTAPPPSTTVPATKIRTSWAGTDASDRRVNGTRYWRGSATLDVTNERGEKLSGVAVTIGVRYYDSRWRDASDLTGTTTGAGSLTFQSPEYRSSSVAAVQFRVKSASRSGMTWETGSTSVQVSRP